MLGGHYTPEARSIVWLSAQPKISICGSVTRGKDKAIFQGFIVSRIDMISVWPVEIPAIKKVKLLQQ